MIKGKFPTGVRNYNELLLRENSFNTGDKSVSAENIYYRLNDIFN